jgi:hypothetical protein
MLLLRLLLLLRMLLLLRLRLLVLRQAGLAFAAQLQQ